MTENLQRIRELSVQAANGTLTNSDRDSIQAEIDQLKDEIGGIGERTTFNGRQLLNGQSDPFRLQVGANSNESVDVPGADVRTSRLGAAPEVTSTALDPSGLQAGELSLNGVDIRATQAVDDNVSTAQTEGSAISVAAACDSHLTGVTAEVNATSVTGGQSVVGGLIRIISDYRPRLWVRGCRRGRVIIISASMSGRSNRCNGISGGGGG